MNDTSGHFHRQNSTDLGVIFQIYINRLKAEIARILDDEDEVHRTLDSPVMNKQVKDERAQHEQSTSQDRELKHLYENIRQELMATLDTQTQSLKSQIENNRQLNENNFQLKEDNRRLHENNLQLMEDNRQLHEISFQLKEDNRQLHGISLQLKEDNRRLHENNPQLKEDNHQLNEIDLQLKEDNLQLNENNLQLEEDNRQLNENNLQLKEDNRRLHENDLHLKEDNRQLHGINLQLKEDNRRLHENNLQLKEDNRQLHEINLQLWEESRSLNEESELAWRLHSTHLDTVTHELDTTKAANNTLTNDIMELRKLYEQLNNEYHAHVENNSLLKSTLDEDKNIVNDLSKENESLKRQKKDLLDKINDVSNLLRGKLPKVATVQEKQQLPPTILGKHYDAKGKSIWWPPKRAREILTAHDRLGDDVADILGRLVRDLSEILTRNDDGDKLK